MSIVSRRFIFLNLIPYAVFTVVCVIALTLEYKFSGNVGDGAKHLLWSYWLFPIFIFYLSYSIGNGTDYSKKFLILRGIVLSLTFLTCGVGIMYLSVMIRMSLGMQI